MLYIDTDIQVFDVQISMFYTYQKTSIHFTLITINKYIYILCIFFCFFFVWGLTICQDLLHISFWKVNFPMQHSIFFMIVCKLYTASLIQSLLICLVMQVPAVTVDSLPYVVWAIKSTNKSTSGEPIHFILNL